MRCVCLTSGRDGTFDHSRPQLGGGLYRMTNQVVPERSVFSCFNHTDVYNRACQDIQDKWKFLCYIVPTEISSKERKYMGKNPWVNRWEVTGSKGDMWVVSQRGSGDYGCSCPGWKFAKAPKANCKHIRAITEALSCGQPLSYDLAEEARRAVLKKQAEQRAAKYVAGFRGIDVPQEPVEPEVVAQVNGDTFRVRRKFKFAEE